MAHLKKEISKFNLVGTVMGLISLVLPWWSMILFAKNNLVASFNLFLWGVIKGGFIRATLPFGWWSYLTFIVVAIGAFLGLRGYMLIKRADKNGRKLLAFQGVFTIIGCIVYLSGLHTTFTTYAETSSQNWWMVAPSETSSGFAIALLDIFNLKHYPIYQITWIEFLNIGFWFAVIAAVFSFVAFLKLRG